MSVLSIVQSLQDVLLQVNGQTRADAPIADRSNTKRTYADWVGVAEKTAQAAEKSVTELPQLNQLALKYRTQSLNK